MHAAKQESLVQHFHTRCVLAQKPPVPLPPDAQRLRELDVNIVKETKEGKDYSQIDNGDVVIFPAFGVAADDMAYFRDKGVNIVDTTCPWVAKVRGCSLLLPVCEYEQAVRLHGRGKEGRKEERKVRRGNREGGRVAASPVQSKLVCMNVSVYFVSGVRVHGR